MKDLKTNFVYRLIYEILFYAVPVVSLPYISRVLGSDGVGEYSYAYSVITYFMMFGALGTVSYGTRQIARLRNDRKAYTRNFWEIEIMSATICMICLLAWLVLIAVHTEHAKFFIALTPFLVGTMFDITWFYMGLERVEIIALAGSAVRIAGLILLFIMVKGKDDVIIYCIINSVTLLAANLSMWLFLPKYLVKDNLKGLCLQRHLKETIVYFVPTIAVSIYLVLDRTLIGLITHDPYQNGYYEQASRIINVAEALSFSIYNTVATARFSYLFAEELQEEIKKRIQSSLNVILFLAYGSVFGLLGIAGIFVPVFFGDGNEQVKLMILMMLPLVIIVAISSCIGNLYYTPSGRRAQSAKYILAGASMNLILNLVMIPVLGAKGAVVASVVAELLITALYIRFCNGFVTVRMISEFSWKRITAGVMMAVVVWLLSGLPISHALVLIIQIFAGVTVYVVLLYSFKDRLVRETVSAILLRILGGKEL